MEKPSPFATLIAAHDRLNACTDPENVREIRELQAVLWVLAASVSSPSPTSDAARSLRAEFVARMRTDFPRLALDGFDELEVAREVLLERSRAFAARPEAERDAATKARLKADWAAWNAALSDRVHSGAAEHRVEVDFESKDGSGR